MSLGFKRLIARQLVKKFPEVLVTGEFITVLTTARRWSES